MSIIAGACTYKKTDGARQPLDKMMGALATLPQDRLRSLVMEDIGFGHLLTYNTPEAVYEDQPVYLPKEQLLFTAQGRIDNREQLSRKLQVKLQDRYPDGTLILQAFLKWGADCVHQLRGDWSFAGFDFKKQELLLARDHTGYTALYYFQDDTGFYFSSSIKSLLALPNYKKQLNEEYFIRILSCWGDTDENIISQTYYKNIYSLTNGQSLCVKEDGKIIITDYWRPENIPLKQTKNKQVYADEMLEVFTKAVNARLRSYKPVAGQLSGGLDSSTVSYIAAELLKRPGAPFTTFSHVPLFASEVSKDRERSFRILDETPFILETARASGNIKPVLLQSSDYSIIQAMTDLTIHFNTAAHGAGNAYWYLDIIKEGLNQGYGTMLSGEGGNGSISFAGLDFLLRLKPATALQHPYQFARNQVVKPIVYKYFNRWLNSTRDINQQLERYVQHIFVRQEIIRKYDMINDIRKNHKEFLKYYPDIAALKSLFLNLYKPRSSFGAAVGQHFGVETRDPTVDVDVLEYFFSIPNEVFFDDHYNNRMLVKRMMKGKLPDSVLFEKKKGLQSADLVYRTRAQAAEISATIEAVRQSPAANEYIDTQDLVNTWQQYLHSAYVEPYQMHRLLKALHFAMFMQTHFD